MKLFEKFKQKYYVDVFDISLKKHNKNQIFFGKSFAKKLNLSDYDIILVANNHKDNEEFLFNNLKKNKVFKKFIIDCWSIINKDKCQYYNYKYKNISSK